MLNSLLNGFNTFLWESILIYLLLGVGLVFTVRLKFFQLRHLRHLVTLLTLSRTKHRRSDISSFQALCTSLAARVGTGNLAGVAVAMSLGGPGAIFWMWVSGFLGLATAFIENALAQLYKGRDSKGNYTGGPAFYISRGLRKPRLAMGFSLLLILAFGFIFNSVQSNSISQAFEVAFGWKPAYVGIALVVLSGLIIFRGIKQIVFVAEWFVPVMAITYLLLTSFIMVRHYSELPALFGLIIKSAFGWQEVGGGVAGYSISQAMLQGIKRGLFSNEAGMGSAPNMAATATPIPNHPATQGYIQMLGVVIDTFVICTATALILLASGALKEGTGITGIALTQNAFSSEVGSWGPSFVAIASFLFSFTAMAANYGYAEINLRFLTTPTPLSLTLFRLGTLSMIFFGTVAQLTTVWTLADIAMAGMALINLITLVFLAKTGVKLMNDYTAQRRLGKLPQLSVKDYPECADGIEPGIWDHSPIDEENRSL